jgi:hypothetical protein
MVPVVPAANASDDPTDAAALRGYAEALRSAVVAAVPRWVVRVVGERYVQWAGGGTLPDAVLEEAVRAGAEAAAAVEPPLRALLEADVDAQHTNPLAIVRTAVRYPTAVLREAGVPEVARDAHAEALFPADVYDLTPGAFGDLDPSVHEPGLTWGAAKAHVVLRRRRR